MEEYEQIARQSARLAAIAIGVLSREGLLTANNAKEATAALRLIAQAYDDLDIPEAGSHYDMLAKVIDSQPSAPEKPQPD